MSVRVLWLVANGFARPEQILGLTFTRKAAAELSKRIFESLLKLRDSELWPEELEYDFAPPTISTYNAYANGLFRDFALAIGYEPEAALLTEAAAFQLAREVVVRHGALAVQRHQHHVAGIVERVGCELGYPTANVPLPPVDAAPAKDEKILSAREIRASFRKGFATYQDFVANGNYCCFHSIKSFTYKVISLFMK